MAAEMPRHKDTWKKLRDPEHEARDAEQRALMRTEIEKALADPDPTRIIGIRSEERVFNALSLLVSRGAIYDFYWAARGSQIDHLGADFLVIPEENEPIWIPLQVKSSDSRAEDHKQKSNILVIVPDKKLPVEILADQLMELLGISTDNILSELGAKIAEALGIDERLNYNIDQIVRLMGFNMHLLEDCHESDPNGTMD